MIATITGYGVGKFIHLVAVVVAFGATYAYPFFIAAAERLNPPALPTVLRGLRNCDRYLVGPGLIVILAAGIYLLIKNDISASETYVTVGFIAILALFGLTHGFFNPQTKRALDWPSATWPPATPSATSTWRCRSGSRGLASSRG